MRSDRDADWPALAVLAGLFVAAWWVVGGAPDVPVIDDWVYAWSVEQLLGTGRLKVLEFSAIYPIAQVLWGAAFAAIGGMSFAALRVSTLVLAFAGCAAVYLTLRELGCRRRTSLLGALALAADPAFFALSFSFMTEVPFVSLSAITAYWYVRAIVRLEPRALWAGAAFAVAAFLVRPVAIVLPAALMTTAVLGPDRATVVRRWLPSAIATVLVMMALQLALPQIFGPLDWAAERNSYLEWVFSIPLTRYLIWTVEIALIATFPLAPLFVAQLAGGRWRAVTIVMTAAVVAVVCVLVLDPGWSPIPNWQTWSLQDIAARAMIDGRPDVSPWSVQALPVVRALGVTAAAGLLAALIGGVAGRSGWTRAQWLIAVMLAGHVAVIHVLWFYNDRYYIALAPLLATLGALAIDRHEAAQWLAGGLIVVWAGVAVTGTRDMLAFNEACAEAARELEASGVPPSEVDAGYALNGWRLYAHPENLPAGSDRRSDVPYVTSRRTTRFSIANAPPPGSEILRVIPLPGATWQAGKKIYVVEHPQPAP